MTRILAEDNPTKEDPFVKFSSSYKVPDENSNYTDMLQYPVTFDSNDIQLTDPHNTEEIIVQMNSVPKVLFRYRMIMDAQVKVLEQLEEEYNRWYAEKYIEIDNETESSTDKNGNVTYKKIIRTEGAKDKLIMINYKDDYNNYRAKIREEKYRLALVKSAVASIDSYSYKLHSILNYKQMLQERNI